MSVNCLGLFGLPDWVLLTAITILVLGAVMSVFIILSYGRLWLQARTSNVKVSWTSLIGMSLRNVKPAVIVKAQVMANQAGLTIADSCERSTASLEAHYLAGGDVNRVILAIIAANRAGIDLDFDRAAAIDLTGRDLTDAVRTSIFPKVIHCPDVNASGEPQVLSAVAKNGIELLTQVRVTVRTNLDQLIGGATEKTIIARVGQGIVSTIGSMDSHEEALAMPSRISDAVLSQGIQSNTAFEIVSIDVATIDVGRNIGARLQVDQAESDTRVARASAESRRADAIALNAEMRALVTEKEADVISAETSLPCALGDAIREGKFSSDDDHSPDSDSILAYPGMQRDTA